MRFRRRAGGLYLWVAGANRDLRVFANPGVFRRFDVDVLDAPLAFTGGYSLRTLSTLRVRLRPVSHRLSAA
jgi:hypothetical protein